MRLFSTAPFLDQRERWFFWLAPLMGAGIALYFAPAAEPSIFWMAAAPVAALGAFVARRSDFLAPLTVALLAVALGFNAAQTETRLVATPMLEAPLAPVAVTGLLIRAEALPQGSRLTLKDPWIRDMPQEKRPGLLRVKTRVPFRDLPEAGTRVNFWGPLWPPSEPVAPQDYDFRRQAFFKGLGGSAVAYSELRPRDAFWPPPFFWDGFNILLEKGRRALSLLALDRLQGEEAAMTAALLSGNQTGIGKEVMEAMRSSGLSHLLSISGVHVSMVGLLLYAPLRFLAALIPWIALRWPIKKIAAAAAILGTTLYTLLVGADAPTLRSALMTGIVLFAVIVDRKALSLRLVTLAAMLIMLTTPSAAMGPSFQMSFAAVLAMIAAYEKPLDKALKEGVRFNLPVWLSGLGRWLRDILGTSLIATAATAPFTLFHFQVFSFYGVLANMIAIPLTSFWVMPCLLLTYLTAPFGLAGPFLDGAGWGLGKIIEIAQNVAAWPFAQIYLPPMPEIAFALFLIGGFWLCLWRERFRLLGLAPIVIACFYPLTVTLPSVFVAPEGDVWAVRLADGRMAAYGKRKEDFTLRQWRKRMVNPELLIFPKRKPPDLGEELSCAASICRFHKSGAEIRFLLEDAAPEAIAQACKAGAAALIAPRITIGEPCEVPILIDAKALQERGSHALVWRKEGVQVETARPAQGRRPWEVQNKTPPAEAEGVLEE